MTLSGATPPPIIDGIQYKRAFNVAGLILYDDKGSERGGFGTADVEGGMAVLALDHPAMDAVGAPDERVAQPRRVIVEFAEGDAFGAHIAL